MPDVLICPKGAWSHATAQFVKKKRIILSIHLFCSTETMHIIDNIHIYYIFILPEFWPVTLLFPGKAPLQAAELN